MGTRYNRFNVLSKYIKIHFFFLKFIFFCRTKFCILHGQVLVMSLFFPSHELSYGFLCFMLCFKVLNKDEKRKENQINCCDMKTVMHFLETEMHFL